MFLDVRLINKTLPNEGSVELYHNGEWRLLCSDRWTMEHAKVTCRALGYTKAAAINSQVSSGELWKSVVTCDGTEDSLRFCEGSDLLALPCQGRSEVRVKCTSAGDFM